MLPGMLVESLRLNDIDLQDERFRISEELKSESIQRSLKEVGLLCPAILLPVRAGRLVVVCGFRRLHALERMGELHVVGRLLDPIQHGTLEAFRIALWDNLAHRRLSLLEAARAVHVLKNECGLASEIIGRDYLPVLGLDLRSPTVQSCLAIHAMQPRLRLLVAEGRITAASAERLAALSARKQDRMADLLERVRLSASRQREVLDLMDSISGSGSIGSILDQGGLTETLEDCSCSPAQRGEKLHRILFEKQNPRLSAAEKRFRAGRAKLGLTGRVRIRPEPYFEKPRVFVEFEASSAMEFREVAESLRKASHEEALEELFKVW